MSIVRNCFNAGCFLAAFGMSIFWCYKFWKDEDLCVVDYKLFESSEDVEMPVLSFCFYYPVYEWKLQSYNATFTTRNYHEFLQGSKDIDGYENVDFDFVSVNLSDSYYSELIGFKNGSSKKTGWPNFFNGPLRVTFSGFYFGRLMKCFGIKLKNKDIAWGKFEFNSNVYPYKIRPKSGKPLQPLTFIHLPNKLLLSGSTVKESWPERNNDQEYTMNFIITSVDVLKRRNKRSRKCIEDAVEYDHEIMKNHLNSIGCKPIYLNVEGNFTVCQEKEQIERAFFDINLVQNYWTPPCTTLQNVNYRYEEIDQTSTKDKFVVQLALPSTFKEILQVKAVDIQTVIGNAGGYVGLFCGMYLMYGLFDASIVRIQFQYSIMQSLSIGYALLQLPDFFHALYQMFEEKLTRSSNQDLLKA